MKNLYFPFLLLLLSTTATKAQSIEGRWEGNFSSSLFITPVQKLVVEIELYKDTLVSGTTHLYYNNNKYEHYTMFGIYRPLESSIFFMEDSTLGVDLGFADNVLGDYRMKLKMTDTSMRFEGTWEANEEDEVFKTPNSKVWLEKKLPKKSTPVAKDVVANTTPQTDKNLQRQSTVQNLVELQADELDSLKIEVLDKAEIDGDVISLYLDDSVLVKKQPITADPIVLYVSVKKDKPLYKIVLAAESQGSVPPCTAYLIITTKHQRKELELWSDSKRNGVLQLFLKE